MLAKDLLLLWVYLGADKGLVPKDLVDPHPTARLYPMKLTWRTSSTYAATASEASFEASTRTLCLASVWCALAFNSVAAATELANLLINDILVLGYGPMAPGWCWSQTEAVCKRSRALDKEYLTGTAEVSTKERSEARTECALPLELCIDDHLAQQHGH